MPYIMSDITPSYVTAQRKEDAARLKKMNLANVVVFSSPRDRGIADVREDLPRGLHPGNTSSVLCRTTHASLATSR
jgi:hypothetical protein